MPWLRIPRDSDAGPSGAASRAYTIDSFDIHLQESGLHWERTANNSAVTRFRAYDDSTMGHTYGGTQVLGILRGRLNDEGPTTEIYRTSEFDLEPIIGRFPQSLGNAPTEYIELHKAAVNGTAELTLFTQIAFPVHSLEYGDDSFFLGDTPQLSIRVTRPSGSTPSVLTQVFDISPNEQQLFVWGLGLNNLNDPTTTYFHVDFPSNIDFETPWSDLAQEVLDSVRGHCDGSNTQDIIEIRLVFNSQGHHTIVEEPEPPLEGLAALVELLLLLWWWYAGQDGGPGRRRRHR